MRIAMLSYHTCPLATLGGKDTGGMNVYVRDLTIQLGSMGIQIDVFTRSQDEHVPHVLHDLGYGNRVVHIPSGPEVPLKKEELVNYVPEFVNGILEFTKNKSIHYDLIHSHYWMSGRAAIELRKVWNIPIIHMFHTLGVMKQRVAQESEEIEGDYRINGEKEVIDQSNTIVAATQAELAQLQWLYQADVSKIVVIPPGVDLRHFYPIPPDEAKEFIKIPVCNKMLLFVGRIEPLKGLEILIKAIAIMRERLQSVSPQFCLAVIGGDPEITPQKMDSEMARLQLLREKYRLQDFVAFLGQRDQNTLPYYYSAANAVVVPSHYESFGMVALEAMACGTPVVASQVGGLAFLVQDCVTGFTVPVDDPEALADRLLKLLCDEELRSKLGKQAAAFAQQYGWEHIAKRIVELYQNTLGDTGNRSLQQENSASHFTQVH
ncbi:MAG: glycosyltransferase family 1 protein [Chloroflexi bacterium]|nr:glycosyltransferase family 1 protein [Chloroflexota bacterium]